MARTISSDARQRLRDAGLWEEYQRYYELLKGQGTRPAPARVQALDLFDRVLEGTLTVPQLYTSDGHVAPLEEVTPSSSGSASPSSTPACPDADLAVLRRKKAVRPMAEFRWVLRNIDEPEIDLDSCPDYEAWKILRYCNENPALFRDLLAEYERRGFSRDNGEDRRDAPLDGDDIIADIDKLRKAGVVK